ncbi:UNVERIFIED_CONTAM: hypothetical protein PYX00_004330 [Menopon gallinae]|uniref:A-kinase anchor protein 7-like phosphoesterase domain-containing protein n=1 Tax=Menopon gallinae TaxID=328185 RepID=A0AAW2I4U4_9NEOP
MKIPNHFIAFKIYDAVIRQRIADVQKKIIEKNPLLNKALIDVRTLHVTLAVTHLENEERIKELQERLQDWGEKDMKAYFAEPIHLTFKGIVNNLLSNSGFYAQDKKFTPHLTLLKLSKNYKLFKKNKDVASDIEDLKDCRDYFGCQDVRDIQLLSMLAKKDDNGYYKCLWEQQTGAPPESTVDSAE